MTAPRLDLAEGPGTTEGWGRLRWPVAALGAAALVAGVVLRFITASPLWLDEALSVNIASLPVDELGEALRRDGHPPLYYLLLHGWMDLFGSSDRAVRAFSGLWGVALIPLVGVAAQRVGGRRVARYAVVLTAASPYAIRYATETRMYSMLSVLVVTGWLLTTDALRRPRIARLAGLALVVGAMLWTHYWSIWFLITAGIALLVHGWRARRSGDVEAVRATGAVLGSFLVGGLSFLPWLPSMLHQAARTGTPWARPMRPTEIVATTVTDFGGGANPEAVILGWFLVALAALALFGRAVGTDRIELHLATRAPARPHAVLVAGTLTVACVAGYLSGSTFASRYASVIFPFVMILAAMGMDLVRHRILALSLLVVVLVLAGAGAARAVTVDRTDAARSAAAIEARARPGDWVVYCPDQLGPSTSRVLEAEVAQVTYPSFLPPQRVDWTDYQDRLDAASIDGFVADLAGRAGTQQIFLVYSTAYSTHVETCPDLFNALGRLRVPEVLTNATEAFEPAGVVLFAAPAP